MTMHNEAFHGMMDTVMGDENRKELGEVMDEVSRYGYGPYSEERLREKIRDSGSDENGEGYTLDRFHGKWQVMRHC